MSPRHAGGLGNLCEIGIVQIRGEFEDAGGLHFQLDESQGVVFEDDHLDRQLQLPKRQQLAHQHRQAAVSRQRDDLAARMTGLGADGLRQSIGHRAMVERAQQPPFAVHCQIPGCPDRRRAHVASEYGVVGGQLVEHLGHILRMDRFPTRFTRRQLIQSLPCLLIMFERCLRRCVSSVFCWSFGSRARSVDFVSPTKPWSTFVRRPSCSPRRSIWTIVASLGKNC